MSLAIKWGRIWKMRVHNITVMSYFLFSQLILLDFIDMFMLWLDLEKP